jgi:hypothetical protein
MFTVVCLFRPGDIYRFREFRQPESSLGDVIQMFPRCVSAPSSTFATACLDASALPLPPFPPVLDFCSRFLERDQSVLDHADFWSLMDELLSFECPDVPLDVALYCVYQTSFEMGPTLASKISANSLLALFRRSSEFRAQILTILANVSKCLVTSELRGATQELLSIANECEDDPEIMAGCGAVLANLLAAEHEFNADGASLVRYFCPRLYDCSPELRSVALDALTKVAINPRYANLIIEQDLDVERLLATSLTSDTESRILKFLFPLLPWSRNLEPFRVPRSDRPAASAAFARRVQPVIAKSLVERALAPNLTLVVLAAVLSVCPVSMTDSLAIALLNYATPESAPYLLSVLLFLVKQPPHDVCFRVLEALQRLPVAGMPTWYCQGIAFVRSQISFTDTISYDGMTLKDLAAAAAAGKLDWMAFLAKGCPAKCLRELGTIDCDLRPLLDFCSNLLSFCMFPKNYGTASAGDFMTTLASEKVIQIQLSDGRTLRVKVPLHAPVSTIEGFINSTLHNFERESLKEKVGPAVNLPPDVPASHLSALFRGTHPTYPTFNLVNKGQKYSIHDSVLSLICDGAEGDNSDPTFVCDEEETAKSFSPKLKPFRSPDFQPLLKFINSACELLNCQVINKNFVREVKKRIKYPMNSIGRLSPTFSLIFEYPRLFPFKIRELAFKLLALNPIAACARLIPEHANDNSLMSRRGICLVVDRNQLVHIGPPLLSKFGGNRIRLNVKFSGEKRSGPGVTREFFAQLSLEFRRMQQQWRWDESLGLFPSPVADAEVFEQLGILVGKALSMDCLLELPFNPAFFELVRNRNVSLADIDPEAERALQGDLAGLDFEFPGWPMAFSKPNVVVDATNQEQFVEMVKEYSMRKNVAKCVDAFRNGFEKVLPLGMLELFSSEEIVSLIAGQSGAFNGNDLISHVEMRGYEKEDEQMQDLMKAIDEFSDVEKRELLKFVTGSNNLPAGGLQCLYPKMSIQKMTKVGVDTDRLLPTTFVCANALNLPPYSSGEILRAKLRLAITDGRDTFLLN